MKIRIKFSKQGSAKFIGHLDVMRYFQKAIRRAGINIRYSSGFNPHQIMSFAAPLGVGLTSKGEYLDIEVEDDEEIKGMKERLNQTMAEGFQILSCRKLPEKSGNAMSLVAAAEYTLSFRPGYEPENPRQWIQKIEDFYLQENIFILKKTKKGQKELDIKPLIYHFSVAGEPPEENSPVLKLIVSTGSAENIKPELILDAYYQYLGQERPAFAFQIEREEVYAKNPNQEDGFLPLEDFAD